MWIATEDAFTFDSQVNEEFELTKRDFLKKMATLFDPLGFLSPFVVRAKVLMQELWIMVWIEMKNCQQNYQQILCYGLGN